MGRRNSREVYGFLHASVGWLRYFALALFLVPNLTFAACTQEGSTIVFINGIFTSKSAAKQSLDDLRDEFNKQNPASKVTFINGYNPSHIAGLGDLAQSAAQALDSSISSHDLNTILLQIHPQLTTRKLLLLGHSQGSFYANSLYDYMLAHGEPKAAVGVYHVGTPASYVAGGGKYITSSNDKVMNAARLISSNVSQGLVPLAAAGSAPTTKPVLPANATLSAAGNGHGFSANYLADASERIVGDIQSAINKLKPEAAGSGECFSAPNDGLGYQAAKAGYAVADTAALGLKAGAHYAKTAAVGAASALAGVFESVYAAADNIAKGAPAGQAVSTPGTQKKIYGAPVTGALQAPAEAEHTAQAVPVLEPVLAVAVQEPEAPIKKVTYLSSRKRSNNAEHEQAPPLVVEDSAPVAEPEPEPVPEPAPEPEPEATTTPVATVPAFMLGGSPVEDSFDSYTYDSSGWVTYGGGKPTTFFATSSEECRGGRCIFAGTHADAARRMYKTGTPVAEGSLTIWKKVHVGHQGASNVWVLVCVGAPGTGGNRCDGYTQMNGGSPDVWHKYYLAWRDNGTAKEFCALEDDTNLEHCAWQASSNIAAGDTPDTVVISGDSVRPDLGDRLWFDDLSSGPSSL